MPHPRTTWPHAHPDPINQAPEEDDPELPNELMQARDVEPNPGPLLHDQRNPHLSWKIVACCDVEPNLGPVIHSTINKMLLQLVPKEQTTLSYGQKLESLACLYDQLQHIHEDSSEARTIRDDEWINTSAPGDRGHQPYPTLAAIPYHILPSTRPVTLEEFEEGMMTCLQGVLKIGNVIKMYVYCDVDTKLHAIIPTLLQQVSDHYPEQFPICACRNASTDLPMDVHDITPRLWKLVGHVDLVIVGT